MGTIDLILILPLALAIINGFRKGFIIEIASLIAFILAIIACLKLTHKLMELIQPYTGNSKWLPFVSYLLVFVLVYLLVLWIGKLLERVIKIIQLGAINRLLGIAFSLLKMCFFISLFFWLADMVHLIPKQSENQSFVYKALNNLAPGFFSWVSYHLPWVKGEVGQIETFFGNLAK
jgi:membrane protein required for colicin V production